MSNEGLEDPRDARGDAIESVVLVASRRVPARAPASPARFPRSIAIAVARRVSSRRVVPRDGRAVERSSGRLVVSSPRSPHSPSDAYKARARSKATFIAAKTSAYQYPVSAPRPSIGESLAKSASSGLDPSGTLHNGIARGGGDARGDGADVLVLVAFLAFVGILVRGSARTVARVVAIV